MVYRTQDQQFRALMNHQNGMKLAREALDQGKYALAWQHAQAHNLSAYDVMQLGLPEKYRPKDFHPKVPRAEGCVR
jgi:hypothetical protein